MEASTRRWLIGILAGFGVVLALTCLGLSVCGGVVFWKAMKGAKIEPRETLLGGTELAYLSLRVDLKEPGHAALVNYVQDRMQQMQRDIAARDPNPLVPWIQSWQSGRQKLAGQFRVELMQYPGTETSSGSRMMVSVQASQMMGMFGFMGKMIAYLGKKDSNSQQEDLPRGPLVVTRDRDGDTTGFSFSSERLLFGSAIDEMRRVLSREEGKLYSEMPVGMETLRSIVKGDEQPFFFFSLTPGATMHDDAESSPWQYVRLVSGAGNIVDVDSGHITLSFLVADPTVDPAALDELTTRSFQRWNLTFTPSPSATRERESVVVHGTVSGFKQAIDTFFDKRERALQLPRDDKDADASSSNP